MIPRQLWQNTNKEDKETINVRAVAYCISLARRMVEIETVYCMYVMLDSPEFRSLSMYDNTIILRSVPGTDRDLILV